MSSPYDTVGKKALPYKIPTRSEFGLGETGAAGAQIESHPFYRHRLNKRYMKRSRNPVRGRRRVYHKPTYDPASGLSESQWHSITKGSGIGGFLSPEEALAAGTPELGLAGMSGGKWYAQSQFGEGGELKEDAQGFKGDSVYGILDKTDNWQGIYEGGGMGLPSWAEGWYEPARYVGVEQQLGRMQEAGPQGEYFRTASDVGIPTGGAYGLDTTDIDMDSPIAKGAAQEFAPLSGDLAAAEQELVGELQSVYGGGDIEGSLSQLERERALAAEELKGERLGIIQERAPKMERAAAQRAATGMAYSGPTERAIRYGQEQGLGSLADIVRRERDTEKTYTSGVAGEIERAKDAQRRFSGQGGALQGYWKGLQDIFEGAQTAATDVAIAGEDLLNAWSDFGGTRNLGGTSLTGMGVTGYSAFQEGDAGGWAPYQQFEGTEGAPQRAESFAQALIDQASAKISGLEINPDVDLSLIGQ